MAKLILVRHGESYWNKEHIFTGWVDVTLTKKGIRQSQELAEDLKKINFDVMFTSCLERARATLLLIAAEQEKTATFMHSEKKYSANLDENINYEIPVFSHADLNERHYGLLQGIKKDEVRKKFGEEQVYLWRRSFKEKPPEGESLEDVCCRVRNFFEEEIAPFLKLDKNVLVSAHGNSLRALVKYIDNISDESIAHLEFAPGDVISYTMKDGELTKDDGGHKFTRPLMWK